MYRYRIELVLSNPEKRENAGFDRIEIQNAVREVTERFNFAQKANLHNKKKIYRYIVNPNSLVIYLESPLKLNYPSKALRSWIKDFIEKSGTRDLIYHKQMFRSTFEEIVEKADHDLISDEECMLKLVKLFMGNAKVRQMYALEILQIKSICAKINI
jgi:hypothetical protein